MRFFCGPPASLKALRDDMISMSNDMVRQPRMLLINDLKNGTLAERYLAYYCICEKESEMGGENSSKRFMEGLSESELALLEENNSSLVRSINSFAVNMESYVSMASDEKQPHINGKNVGNGK